MAGCGKLKKIRKTKQKAGLENCFIEVRVPLIMSEATQKEPDTGYIFQTVGRQKKLIAGPVTS